MNRFLFLCWMALAAWSCSSGDDPEPTRTYRMGFQNSAPRPEIEITLQALAIWTEQSDAAMITTEVPWNELYEGQTVQQYIAQNYVELVNYYRQKNLKLWIYIDPANGLDRTSDSSPLVTRGKSIAQPAVQKLYQKFVVAMDSMLRPDHLGLALETNLIRLASPDSIYQGVKKASRDAAQAVRARNAQVKLSVSVQADVAWGRLGGTTNTYVGVEQDFVDFPFLEEMGVSSYPYFGFTKPEDIPSEYYQRLKGGRNLPLFVSEGGWTSKTFEGPFGTITSSEELQSRYIERHAVLLETASAIAIFQLPFTDIDLTTVPPGVDPSIRYFAYLGLLDEDMQPKAAWSTWQTIFRRTLRE